MNTINVTMLGVGFVLVILNSWMIYKRENSIIGIVGQAVLPALNGILHNEQLDGVMLDPYVCAIVGIGLIIVVGSILIYRIYKMRSRVPSVNIEGVLDSLIPKPPKM